MTSYTVGPPRRQFCRTVFGELLTFRLGESVELSRQQIEALEADIAAGAILPVGAKPPKPQPKTPAPILHELDDPRDPATFDPLDEEIDYHRPLPSTLLSFFMPRRWRR